jgi:hypothetical protein
MSEKKDEKDLPDLEPNQDPKGGAVDAFRQGSLLPAVQKVTPTTINGITDGTSNT